jgi:O-antigen/teichoic acid export membrane protein
MDKLLATILCGIMLAGNDWFAISIQNFVLAQTCGLFITTVLAGVLVAKQASFKFKFWSKRYTAKILKSTLPYALLVFLMGIYNRIDAVMLERLLPQTGSVQAGIYAAAYRVFDAANQFGFLFSTILLPMFAMNFRKHVSNTPLFELGLKSIGLFAIGVTVFCFTWDDLIVNTLYHHNEAAWLDVFRITLLCFIPASLTYIAGTLLTAKGEIIALCTIALVGVIFNLISNFLLIPVYGALGCAIAALATNLLMLLLHLILVVKKGAASSPVQALIRIGVFCVCIFIIAGLLCKSDFYYTFQWFFALIAGLILAFALQLFSFKEVVALLKSKQQSAS